MKLTPLILTVLFAGCASPQSRPAMSKAEAIRILEQEDPYSREAILTLQDHAKQEYEAKQREREARMRAGEPVPPSPFASGNMGINQEQ